MLNNLLKKGVKNLYKKLGLMVILTICYASGAFATTTVENADIALTFDLTSGISITSIYDKVNSFQYLTSPSSFFLYAVNMGYGYSSNTNNTGSVAGVVIDSQTLSTDHKTFTIVCHETNAGSLSFTIVVNTPTGAKAAIVTTTVHNTGGSGIFLKMITPNLTNLTCPGYTSDASRMLGMVPQEVGTVATLGGSPSTVIGRPGVETTSSLPPAMNDMEVVDVYDRDGTGGVFFADLDGNVTGGVAPIQFQAWEGNVYASWAQNLASGATVTLPRLAIGVHHSGDYHQAIDYYTAAHSGSWSYPTTPAWLKEAGAIWSSNEEGSGGSYEIWPNWFDLSTQISTFDSLPALYRQAVAQGTNVLYLNNYWEGDGTATPRYLFKGDYIPRADLGGAAALTRGISAVHALGGKVIVYVEPFIIAFGTAVANAHGREWAARDASNNFWIPYAGNYVLMANEPKWQSYITSVAKRLVSSYGVDGVFLDSWGERWNLCYKDSLTNVMATAMDWNKGVLDLADSVLNGMRTIKSDAVVLSETHSGELNRHENGGTSADFVWDNLSSQNRIIASPIRYGIPQANYFVNGSTINQAVQMYAAGHSLALNSQWAGSASYLKRLLDIRRSYKDAMVYGSQSYQPATGTLWVGSYFYQGTTNKVITMANINTSTENITLGVGASEANSTWVDILTGDVYTASGQNIGVSVPGSTTGSGGLRILVENAVLDPGFELQTTNTAASPWTGSGNAGIDRNIGFQFAGLNEGWVIGTTTSKLYQNVTVKANTDYNLTCWVQSGSGTTNGDFGIMVPGGSVIAHHSIGYVSAYTPITVSFNSGANTTLQVYGSVGTGSPTPYVRYDNISLSLQ